ncbi:MAG: hypothetical protein IJX14_03995 [Clostridia bacterium]|nr:hypothetical protein [Clostridia bacterium]
MAREKRCIETGMTFGRWTALTPAEGDGEARWHCRCSCGTERDVLERSLLYGTTTSCGCARRENVSGALAHDLTGRTFGELTVLQKAEKQYGTGGIRWTCLCSCGKRYDVRGALLENGTRTHCSEKCHELHYAYKDITGQRFFDLTAVRPTDKRDIRGSIIWVCRCDCGNEKELSYNRLVYGKVKSCGCRPRTRRKKQPVTDTV